MNPFVEYLRWRHSKGYGVHSPYAYRFVTDVLRPGDYGYYAYHVAERLLKRNRRAMLELVKFTIRLAVFLGTKRIIYGDSLKGLAEVIAKSLNISWMALNKSRDLNPEDLIILDENSLDAKSSCLSSPVLALKPDFQLRKVLEEPQNTGLLMKGKNKIVFIPRKDMAYVSYDILM